MHRVEGETQGVVCSRREPYFHKFLNIKLNDARHLKMVNKLKSADRRTAGLAHSIRAAAGGIVIWV